MDEIETKEEDGLVTMRFTAEEANRLKSLLSRRDNAVRRPRIHREGNQIIIDTGLDEFCTFNKGTPQEVHALRIYQRAESHEINENREVFNIIPAVTVVERVEGGYCYMDGKDVNKREDLDILPKEWRQDAIDWFNARESGKKRTRA